MDADGIARQIVDQLEQAWNAADGDAFGQPFALDADFVDIRGEHHRGQRAISEGHRDIFASVFQGSRISYRLKQVRRLTNDVLLLHSEGELDVPAGPLSGHHRSTQSMVVVHEGEGWTIVSFHNTLVPQQR